MSSAPQSPAHQSPAPQPSAHQSPAPQRRARSTRDLRAATLHVAARLDELGLLDPAVSASVREHVARPARGLREAVRAIASYPADHDERLLELAAEALTLSEEWERHFHQDRLRARDLVAECLTQLRSCRGESELGDQICPAAARAFGVQWALVARIHEDTWSQWRRYEAPGRSRGRADPDRLGAVPLADLPTEAEVVRTGRALSSASSASRSLGAEAGRVRVAPVPVAGRVAALLHLPEPAGSDEDDDLDERLETFAVGLGRILERELLYERFRSQRSRVRSSLAAMERIMTSLDTGVDLVRLVGREHADTVSAVGLPLVGPSPAFDNVLTSRERDVMALVVLGRDNTAIAQQLAITTNTVKSHVRSIMRKYGAVNRTELISLHQSAPGLWSRGQAGTRGASTHPRPLGPR